MATREFRWKKRYIDGRIICLSVNYVLYQSNGDFGNICLVQRKNCHVHSDFTMPIPSAMSALGNEPHSDFWRARSDLIIWNRSRTLIILRLSANVVEYRVLESAEEIRGAILLKGSLESLSVEIIGQEPCWSTQSITNQASRKIGLRRFTLIWI